MGKRWGRHARRLLAVGVAVVENADDMLWVTDDGRSIGWSRDVVRRWIDGDGHF